MLHVFLAADIISFSLGLVAIALSFLAFARSGIPAFKYFAFLFLAAVLILLAKTIDLYEQATLEVVFGGFASIFATALAVPGSGLLAYMIWTIAFVGGSNPGSFRRRAAPFAFMVVAAALGGARELFPNGPFWILNSAGLAATLACAFAVAGWGMTRAEDQGSPALVRRVTAASVVAVPLLILQVICRAIGLAPASLRQFPLVQTMLYLAVTGLVLSHLVRYLFEPALPPGFRLPEEVASRYGISPRELEIITMLVQGYTNKVIGEKLFISTTTVKNHIYHIYQKTGVTNKIQLINLINSPK